MQYTYKYQYIGQAEVHVPAIGKTVKNGDIIETNVEINHPDFVYQTSEAEVTKPKKK